MSRNSDIGEPTLEDLVAAIARGEQSTTYGPLPAKVVTYDSTKQIVDAKPLVLVSVEGELQSLPVIRSIPVRWPSGASWAVTAPLAAGDVVWLHPAGADISQWLAQGAEDSQSVTHRRSSLSDCYAEPGSRPFSSPLSGDAIDSQALTLLAAKVKLGGSGAVDYVALASVVNAIFDDIENILENHVHTAPEGCQASGLPTSAPLNSGINLTPVTISTPDVSASKVLAI